MSNISRDDDCVKVWSSLLGPLRSAFTKPGWCLFQMLLTGWVLCTSRRTIVGISQQADPDGQHAHDAFHRFVRCGSWSVENLWKMLAVTLVNALLPADAIIKIDTDDTLVHRTGRKVDGAGAWRDAVQSTGKHTVISWGLNVLVVTLRVTPPWGGEPLGLPIWVKVHRKDGPKLTQMTVEAITTIAEWFPGRKIQCCGDGAFASTLMGLNLDQVTSISRIRRDAALYEQKPERNGKRGRPRTRGKRMDSPQQIAAKTTSWQRVNINHRGKSVVRLFHTRTVLWYNASRKPVLLVICRDPEGKEPDDFFVCSDITMVPQEICIAYTGRWAIEETFRATKQTIHVQQPQSWRGEGPARATTLGFLLHTLIWWWFLSLPEDQRQIRTTPWFTAKNKPSFADAIAKLRRELWGNRIFADSGNGPISNEIRDSLLDALANAA